MTWSASDPADAIQAGIYTILHGDTTLMNLVTGVYDGVPEEVTAASEQGWITLGEMNGLPEGTHAHMGRDTSCAIHTWTRAESSRPGNVIGARIAVLLNRQEVALDAVVSGHKVWLVRHTFSQTLVDPEPGIRHRIDRYLVRTAQDS